ncbi:MAG: extracellular solute-binding protein [Chloroflexi bacterium]|nr:extracellular solute-binding protein [Chloroflexota bacterium]
MVPPDELAAHLGGAFPFHPRALALTRREEKLYGLAWNFSTPTLFFNASLLREAGLDPDRPPRTWDEVKAMGLQVAQHTGQPALYIACLEWDWCAQALLLSNGGQLLSPDRRQLRWTDPANLEVYRFWQELVRSGVHARLRDAEAAEAFAAGKLAFYLQSSVYQATLIAASRDKWELRSAAIPAFGSRPVRPTNSGAGLAIFATDPVRQRAAWELMKFLTSPEAYVIVTRDMGYLPLRTGIVNDERYLKGWPQLFLLQPNLQQLDQLEPWTSYPGDNSLQILSIFLKTQEAVVFQGADPERSWREAQERAERLLP